MQSNRARIRNIRPHVTIADTRCAKPPAKRAAPIYSSSEHRAWRAEVIRRAGGRCEWPGCGRMERRMFADHITELQDGGDPSDPANGQCLCGAHHTHKTVLERARRHNATRV